MYPVISSTCTLELLTQYPLQAVTAVSPVHFTPSQQIIYLHYTDSQQLVSPNFTAYYVTERGL